MESVSPSESARRRAIKLVGITLALYVVTVASHLGEFWPFSIYPMFSQAGKPWTRAMVLDTTETDEAAVGWGPWSLDALPGDPLALKGYGVSTNDVSKFVQLTERWDDTRLTTLRVLFKGALEEGRTLMLLRADGRLKDGREVDMRLTGLVRLSPDGSAVNPALVVGSSVERRATLSTRPHGTSRERP